MRLIIATAAVSYGTSSLRSLLIKSDCSQQGLFLTGTVVDHSSAASITSSLLKEREVSPLQVPEVWAEVHPSAWCAFVWWVPGNMAAILEVDDSMGQTFIQVQVRTVQGKQRPRGGST